MSGMARCFDGAYNIAFMDAMGRMFIARDPLGLRPMCWAVEGRLFAAASESVRATMIVGTSSTSAAKRAALNVRKASRVRIATDGDRRLSQFAKSGSPVPDASGT